jgi:hypothetical protein
MAFFYLGGIVLLLLAVVGLGYAAARVLEWGFATTKSGTKTGMDRKAGSIVLALIVTSPLSYPFVRDAYRNALCNAESGFQVFVPAASWIPRPSSMGRERENISVMVGDAVRSYLAPGLAEDYSRNSRGLGVYELTFSFVDSSSGVKLATVTRFQAGSMGRSFFDIGLTQAESCSPGQYLLIRKQYVSRVQ